MASHVTTTIYCLSTHHVCRRYVFSYEIFLIDMAVVNVSFHLCNHENILILNTRIGVLSLLHEGN